MNETPNDDPKRPVGRPLTRDTPASSHIHLRSTPEQKARYNNRARKDGKTLAAWIFDLCDKASTDKEPLPSFPGIQIKEMPMPPGILGVVTSPDDPTKTVIIKE